MIKNIFGMRAAPAVIAMDKLYRDLHLKDPRFESDPDSHIAVLDVLGEYSLRGSSHFGPARSYYADPEKTIDLKPRPAQFRDEPYTPGRTVRSSARISFTTEQRGFGKSAFALIIVNDFKSRTDAENAIVFGLFGICDKNGQLNIKKIMIPGKDEAHRITGTAKIPVTQDNLDRALRFAARCTEALLNKEPFYPRQCLDQADARPAVSEIGRRPG